MVWAVSRGWNGRKADWSSRGKGRDPAITVLQIEQPLAPGAGGLTRGVIDLAELFQSQQRAGEYHRHRAHRRAGRPGPATGRGVGKGMHLAILLLQSHSRMGRARHG